MCLEIFGQSVKFEIFYITEKKNEFSFPFSSLEKKANKMFLKASQTLEQSTGLTLGARRASSHFGKRGKF